MGLTGGKAGGACSAVGDEEVMSSLKGGMPGVMVSQEVYITFQFPDQQGPANFGIHSMTRIEST